MAQKKSKSDKETQAIQAIQKAKSPDEVIAAAENLITKFADTDFKSAALTDEAQAYEQKGDSTKALSYGRLAVEADPKNSDALVLVALELAGHTRDADLDKTEKLAEADKDVKAALEIIPTEAKPGPQVSDAQWEDGKKTATARDALWPGSNRHGAQKARRGGLGVQAGRGRRHLPRIPFG